MIVQLLFTVFLALALVVIVALLENRRKLITLQTRKRRGNPSDLRKFQTYVHFNDYPKDFEVNNTHDCNARSLRVCKLDDPLTLAGCKELNVRCRHFDREFVYSENGVDYTLPANKTPNEGYALAIAISANSCNPYHGDPVLIARDTDSRDYMLICRCKKDGYIGNDQLLGNCTTVRICDGKIKNINVPFEKIECVCPADKISRWSTNVAPTCQQLTVLEANTRHANWSFLLQYPTQSQLLSIKTFQPTIRDNLNVDNLLSPCSHPVNDPVRVVKNAYFSTFMNSCVFADYGVPLKRNLLEKSKAQLMREKAKFNAKLKTFAMLDGVLDTSSAYQSVYATDHVLTKRQITAVRVTADWLADANRYARVSLGSDIGFSKLGNLFMNDMSDRVDSGYCVKSWGGLKYNCNVYPCRVTNVVNGLPKVSDTHNNPWGNDDWIAAELFCQRFEDSGFGVTNNPSSTQIYGDRLKLYGIEYTRKPAHNTSLMGFENTSDWEEYRKLLDEFEEEEEVEDT